MASQAVIRRCAAIVNAHIFSNMLRFPKRRAPWLTAWYLFFGTLLPDNESVESVRRLTLLTLMTL
jgi:hypothetical protein